MMSICDILAHARGILDGMMIPGSESEKMEAAKKEIKWVEDKLRSILAKAEKPAQTNGKEE